VILYKVVQTTESDGRFKVREYLADEEDAWYLWYQLTTAADEAGGRRSRMVSERTTTMLSLFGPLLKVSVKVFDLQGHEVCPEHGVRGMHEYKPRAVV
jgi:hypothetical protein